MASTDAKPVPQKNVAMRITFPLRDGAGDLVTGATGLDSEVSKDAGTFADCTNEATEIATASGIYYLDLTSTEMNADTVAIIVKSSTAKTFAIVMYPQEAGDIQVNVTYWNGTAVSTPATAGIPEVNIKNINNSAVTAAGAVTFPGTIASTTNITAGTITTVSGNVTGSVGSVVAAVDANLTTWLGVAPLALSSQRPQVLTALIGTNVVNAAALASDAVTEIAAGVWNSVRASYVTAGSFGEGVASVQGDVTGNVTGSVGSVAANGIAATSIATGAITAAKFAASAIDAAALATDAVAEIQSGLALASATTDIQGRLPAALVGGRIDASVGAMAADTITSSALATSAVTEIGTGVATTTLTESYSAVGVEPTFAQAMYLALQRLYNFNIFSTTITVTKLDGTTTAAQITTNSATAPTTSERTT